ncbi:MAG: bifunctional 5,10-methylene-tetrahydrofolate dehydrogenase/5,10-methylene-tetrahydrofolate cyclohydrolase, partial [Clostridiales bacterium]|nr:bifunctional 5,10-methylene-tetrahydrofolate dehydrogenase/5,10-methylene-tetrahydrofolate cyclohydrolase [Clostridiales bacterium]
MAKLLDGKKVAAALKEKQRTAAAELKLKGVIPTLGIIRIGGRKEDLAYENGVIRRCRDAGVAVNAYALPSDAAQSDLLALIDKLNNDNFVHGILMFRPLPEHISIETVRGALSVKKDVDGVGDGSLAGLLTGAAKGF